MTIEQGAEHLEIVLCDDHAAVRRTLSSLLARVEGFRIAAEGCSADDAVDLAERYLPNLMLLDLNMPGGGIAAATSIFARLPVIKTIVLTSSDDEDAIATCLVAGAFDVLAKDMPAREIITRMRRVAAGQASVTPVLAARLVQDGRYLQPWYQEELMDAELDFLPREQQILLRLAQGLSEDEIASNLGTTSGVIGRYCFNILHKVHVAALTGSL